jgi:hypothetical protein
LPTRPSSSPSCCCNDRQNPPIALRDTAAALPPDVGVPERSPKVVARGRPTEAPVGRTRGARCIGTMSARANSRSTRARAPSLPQ